jgi:glycosyltransferase involved in cell wall biosynthesis
MPTQLPALSVFFPCHNEVGNLERVVASARDVLPRFTREWEVIIVDDGSTDGTGALADRLAAQDPRLRVVHHPQNRGYGGALQSGFAASRYDYVFFTDGDGQFDLNEIALLLPLLDRADLVLGYRLRRADPAHRRLYAFAYHLLIRVVLGLKVRDLDCAFKLIPRRVLEAVTLTSNGALISAELLLKAKHAGFSWVQVGVHHYPRRAGQQSGGSVKVILRMFRELWRLRRGL